MISRFRRWRPAMSGLSSNTRTLLLSATFAMCLTLVAAVPAARAAVDAWPQSFHAEQMPVVGGTQYVRVGGSGPAVVLLHGFGDTGDMWVPLARILARDHTVVVPDLRGMGLSSHPENGYEKTAQARTSHRRRNCSARKAGRTSQYKMCSCDW